MKKFSIVQAVILGVASIAILAAVFMFAFGGRDDGQSALSQVVIWGTIPKETFSELFRKEFSDETEDYSHIIYVEKPEVTFEEDFVAALAEGRGPDLILFRETQLLENKDRLIRIPYTSYDKRSYQETFIEEANILALDEGFAGFPFYLDPLVLYYNKDILNSNGIARPPVTWTELLSITPTLTEGDSSFNISKSAIGLGTFDNVVNAKEIVWTLIMQAGNNVIIKKENREDEVDIYESILQERLNFSVEPAQAALNFYTQFSNPGKTIYSWNRSLPNTQDFFLAGNSAFYLGFASELPTLRLKNPNLNFDVAVLPQSQTSQKKTTYGKMYFLGMTRDVKDLNSAFSTAVQLSNKNTQEKLSKITGLPSVRRDILTSEESSNSFDPIFRRSALISKGILEPNKSVTGSIVRKMVESIISGESEIKEAVNRADGQLNLELEK